MAVPTSTAGGSYTVGGSPIYPAQFQLQNFTTPLGAGSTTQLSWPTSFADSPYVVGGITLLSSAGAGAILQLPPANQSADGAGFTLINTGTDNILIQDASGTDINILTALTDTTPNVIFYYLVDNSTLGGTWGYWVQGTGSSSTSAYALAGYGLYAAVDDSTPPAVLNTMCEPKTLTPSSGSTYNVIIDDSSKLLIVPSTDITIITLPHGVPEGMYVALANQSLGLITLTPQGGDTINGSATYNLLSGTSGFIMYDGTSNWTTVSISTGGSSSFGITVVTILTGQTTVNLTIEQMQSQVIYLQGTLEANVVVIVPGSIQGEWIFTNSCTVGVYTVQVKFGGGTLFDLVQAENRLFYSNLTQGDFFNVPNFMRIVNGGTEANNKDEAFNNLSPTATAGDMIFRNSGNDNVALSVGGNPAGSTLQLIAGTPILPGWGSPYANGDILNFAAFTPAITPFTVSSNTTDQSITFAYNAMSSSNSVHVWCEIPLGGLQAADVGDANNSVGFYLMNGATVLRTCFIGYNLTYQDVMYVVLDGAVSGATSYNFSVLILGNDSMTTGSYTVNGPSTNFSFHNTATTPPTPVYNVIFYAYEIKL